MSDMSDVNNERRDSWDGQGEWPAASVIIVTRDRHEAAEAAVRSVLQVDYPAEKLEVVVIEETDQPRPIEGDRVRYVAIPWRNLGLGFARNQGVKHSQGEVFAFTDDDCLIHRDWLRELVGPLLTEEGTAAIAGAVLVPVCGPVGQCENILGFPGGGVKFIEEAQGEIVRRATFSTCNCAVYRWAVEEVGGFREFNKSSGEDELLSRQISARHPLLYTPHAIVWHEPRDSFGKVYGWLVRRGHSRVEMAQNVTDKGALYRRMALQSPLVRLAMANMAGMAVGLPLWFSSLVLVVLYYFSVLYRYRWSRNYHPSWKTFLLLPWVKATMDLAMDIGTIGKLFARGKTEG
jgi:glycosyltransferase involved in cell wall biosynthesis